MASECEIEAGKQAMFDAICGDAAIEYDSASLIGGTKFVLYGEWDADKLVAAALAAAERVREEEAATNAIIAHVGSWPGSSMNMSPVAGECNCWACIGERGDNPGWFVVCPTCGNKRCPHCSDHRFKCTGSNKPDQVGELSDPADYPAKKES